MPWIRRNERGPSGSVAAAEIVDTQAGTVTPETNGSQGAPRSMTAAEVTYYALRDRSTPYVFESRGSADATVELADVIDDCLGRTDPTSGTRTARYPIVLAPGTHVVSGNSTTSPITVQSALGLHLTGAGMGVTRISPVGTSLPAVLDLNGLSRSVIGGFTISAANTTTCTAGVWLRWGSGISRSTNYDVLRDIAVENLKFVEGIRLGEEGRNNQVDTSKLYNCIVKGQWTSGETTWWQSALTVGHNVSANNLNHTGYGLSLANCAKGIDMRRSQFAMYGGEFGTNGADLYLTGHTHYLTVCGVRSEGSARLLDGTGLSAPATVTIEDYDYRGNALHADERFIKMFSGGTLTLSRVRVLSLTSDAVRPKIYLRPEKDLHVIMDGHECRSPMETWMEIDQTLAAVTGTGQGWCETNSAGQPARRAASVLFKNGAPYSLALDASNNVVGTLIVAD